MAKMDLYICIMANITKAITYSIPDLQMAYDLHWSRKQPIRKSLFLITAVISFLSFLTVDYYSPSSADANYSYWLALKVVLLLYSILCIAFHTWWYRTYAKRAAKKLNSIGKEFTVTFSDSGIKVANAKGRGDTPWSAYGEAIISEQIILLYRNDGPFNYYPRRFFDGHEYQAVKELIKKYVPKVE